MAECKDISERLLMALHPEEFPEGAREVREHMKECSECKAELESLGRMVEFLREHRSELAAAAQCPPAEALVAAALDEPMDASTAAHVQFCPECNQYVDCIRDLIAEGSAPLKVAPAAEERLLIHRVVESEYGPGPALEETRQRRFGDFFRSLFRLPSVAVAAAAAVAVVLWLQIPSQEVLTPAFSDAVWRGPGAPAADHGLIPKRAPIKRNTVAVMILAAGKDGRLREDLQSVYERLDISERVKATYEIITPRKVKQALAGVTEARTLDAWVELVFGKLSVDYFLTFQVSRSGTEYGLKAALFQRGRPATVGAMVQTGLSAQRIPSRISSMGAELLTEAGAEKPAKSAEQR